MTQCKYSQKNCLFLYNYYKKLDDFHQFSLAWEKVIKTIPWVKPGTLVPIPCPKYG